MKRSQINALIDEARAILDRHCFLLPPFAYIKPEDWKSKNHEYDEIRRNGLGWDVTDFGSGEFEKTGLFLFTLRNGNPKDGDSGKVYAEKIMIVKEGQVTPFHFHWFKQEDIINRGGGNLLITVYNATEDDKFSDEEVEVQIDGRRFKVPAGTEIRLRPGESMTMTRRLYHTFRGEEGCGTVLVGEVSRCNDDVNDNRFYTPCGRFSAIEEDEPARYLLCNEYPEYEN